jgi:hypothetical protein
MLSRNVPYKEFDGSPAEATVWFHLSKARLMENLDIEEDLKKIQKLYSGDKRTLTTPEVKIILLFIKRIIQLSVGERYDDGKKFRQNEKVWSDFNDSPLYDAFLMTLFGDNMDNAWEFVTQLIPEDLREEALKQAQSENPELFKELNSSDTDIEVTEDMVQEDDRPAWLRENRPPTPEEFGKATREQQLLAYQMKSNAS